MIEYKEVELADKEWIEPLLVISDMRGCHQNFTNIFSWSKIYNYRIAEIHNHLVVKVVINDLPFFFYPAGSDDIQSVFEEMKLDATNSGHEFALAGVSPKNIAVIDKVFPDHFEYKDMRESYDYVYLIDKLVTLKGNKLHSKRNHINRFIKENPDWSFEQITADNLSECWEMNLQWCKLNSHHKDDDIAKECCAVRRCFENFTALGLEGGLIRVKGRVIAYTMGERLNSDTYVIHIEKAFGDISGSYQIINREYAAYIQKNYPQLIYMNREEDMGFEGLRKAKLSYQPDIMEEKYYATYFEG